MLCGASENAGVENAGVKKGEFSTPAFSAPPALSSVRLLVCLSVTS